MKKVLIIANLFHASPRIPGIAKYLPDFGWEATILTVPIKEDPRYLLDLPFDFKKKVKIIEVPHKGDILVFWRKIFKRIGFNVKRSILSQVKRKTGFDSSKSFIDYIFRFYEMIFAYPDEEKNWIKPCLGSAEDLLKKEKFQAIISSSSPVVTHLVAKSLKEKHKIPWIADLRDLWSQNHDYPYGKLRQLIDRRLEKKTLLPADVLVTVSQPLEKKLKDLHKKEQTCTITNGFNPERVNEPAVELVKKFTITYTGQVYSGKQDPFKVLNALKDLIEEKAIDPANVEVRFYGPEINGLEKKIKEYGLFDVVKYYGTVPKIEAQKKQWESQLLLLFNWEDKEEKGVYTGKIFEYLAAKRPILATGGFGQDVIEMLLNKTNAGVYAKNEEEIKRFIKEFYLEYKEKGKVDYEGNSGEIDKYNYKEIAKKFTDVLNQLT